MNTFEIAGRKIGPGNPCYIIAELSANHGQKIENALALVKVAKDAGADAIKLQTYRADTITIDCDADPFMIKKGTVWEGQRLYDLYEEAHTPWDWHKAIFDEAAKHGLHCFSSPFDDTAVDFLEELDAPAYKIASFELIDIPLIKYIAKTGKPILMSTGMSSEEEISINKVCFGNDFRFFVEKTDVPANRRTAVFHPCFISVAARVGARAEQSSVIRQRGFSGSKL